MEDGSVADGVVIVPIGAVEAPLEAAVVAAPLLEAAALSFRPLRVIVGLDYKAADAWFIEF